MARSIDEASSIMNLRSFWGKPGAFGLDRVPDYQFNEFHATRIHASPSEVFRSLKTVTAREIWFFRALTWIRSPRFSRSQRESIMAAPSDKPLLEVAQHDFLVLEEDPDRELV